MFEQEIEMEKRTSSIVPLLLIVSLIVAVVGVSIYFVIQSRKVLTTAEANSVVTGILDGQGPITLRFQTGIDNAVD
jgi:flagellar basal body-associated protein FliL